MMDREIDFLLPVAQGGCLIVEKDTHVPWSAEELLEAARAGSFLEPDCPLVPTDEEAYESPYPGCLQLGGNPARADANAAIGETRHFMVFTNDDLPADGVASQAALEEVVMAV